ncbi:MAG: FtsX-like permease family protein [Acidobacteriota bacterium]
MPSDGRRRLFLGLPLVGVPSFPWLLALRYLRSARRDAYIRFLSTVAACGIAVGVAALILVLAALSGLHDKLLAQILAAVPHLEVSSPAVADRDEWARAASEAVRGVEGVESVHRIVRGQGWVMVDDLPLPVIIVGYDDLLPRSFPEATSRQPGLYLPQALARRWGVFPGDVLTVISPRSTLTPLGPAPRTRPLEVVGTFRSQAAQGGDRIAIPLSDARRLFGRSADVLEVSVTEGLDGAVAMAPEIAAVVPSAEVSTWRELNRSLYFVLRLEKVLLFLAVGLVVLVATLALVVDLALVVTSKRAEIGALGALGTSPRRLRHAFLLLGALLAAVGLVAGTALGITGAWAMDHFRLLSVPGQVMFVDHIPFQVTARDLTLVLGSTLALVLFAAWNGARRASALEPVEAMRR